MENIENTYTAVLYIDGSSKPTNPGPYGVGIHGYIFNNQSLNKTDNNKPSKFIITNIGYIEIEEANKYTYKTVIPTHYINGYISNKGEGTNNIAELQAFIEACKYILNLEKPKVSHIVLNTDSTYVIGVINVITNNNLEIPYNKVKINVHMWERIATILKEFKNKNITYEVIKILGHSTNIGNHLADRLANIASEESINNNAVININIRDSKGYWKYTEDRHPFLLYRQLFFLNTYRESLKEYAYAIMKYDKDEEPGIKSHKAAFGLVILKNRPNYIEDVITYYQKKLGSTSIIFTVNLENLYKQQTCLYYNIYKEKIFNYDSKKRVLYVMNEIPIVHEIYPPGLAIKAIDKVMELNNFIINYTNNIVSDNISYIDITNKLFSIDNKGKYKLLINNNEKLIMVQIIYNNKEINIPLVLGKDILERNHFKHIEKNKPKVTLVIVNISDTCLEYYTIIEMTDTGDISIWCNFYNNKIYI